MESFCPQSSTPAQIWDFKIPSPSLVNVFFYALVTAVWIEGCAVHGGGHSCVVFEGIFSTSCFSSTDEFCFWNVILVTGFLECTEPQILLLCHSCAWISYRIWFAWLSKLLLNFSVGCGLPWLKKNKSEQIKFNIFFRKS